MTLRFASIKATTLLNLKAAQQQFERDPSSGHWLLATQWMLAWQQLHNLGWDSDDERGKQAALCARLTATPEEYLWPEIIVEVATGLSLADMRRGM